MDGHRDRIRRRMDYCLDRIASINGLECETPGGAFYLFVRITNPEMATDDKAFVLNLLHQHHVLVVHGSGFSPEFGGGHFRMVCLPPVKVLAEALDRVETFLGG
jgi:aspartate/methionine/tyrosine aminotransferase